jgi:hypothetical protein
MSKQQHPFNSESDRPHLRASKLDIRRARISPEAVERLGDWFAGNIALSRAEAHSLLEGAIDSGYLERNRGEFVAAIKALAAGPGSWPQMGYCILPDD